MTSQVLDRCVVILGAGASADFGVPTLSTMFHDTQVRNYLSTNTWLHEKLQSVFWDIRGHTIESSESTLNIEQMLTILRDASLDDSVPDILDTADLLRFQRGLYSLIQHAVFVGKDTNSRRLNPLISFCKNRFAQTTWATFNWDCIFEASFYYSQPSFYMSGQTRSNPTTVVDLFGWHHQLPSNYFLKLHGGINWWMIENVLTYLRWSRDGDLAQRWSRYESGLDPLNFPVILEPSYHKFLDPVYQLLQPQWERFASELISAKHIIVIGYSLPEGDTRARSVISSSFQANPHARWLLIDPSESTAERYRHLIGDRQLTWVSKGLAEFNIGMEDYLADWVTQ